MSGSKCPSQPSLHPSAGQVTKKPVPVKPKISPSAAVEAMGGQGSSSGLAKRTASSQRQWGKAEVQRSLPRQMGPNGWRAPRKESNRAGEWTNGTNESEEELEDDEEEEEEDDQNKIKQWRDLREMVKRKETSSGREQKWRTSVPKKESAVDVRGRPSSLLDIALSSEDEDRVERTSVALSRCKNRIYRKSPVDRRKSTRSLLDNSYSLDPIDNRIRQSLTDSGYASSNNSLSSPLDLPAPSTPAENTSDTMLRTKRLDDELSRRLGEIRLDKDLTKQNADLVNSIVDSVLSHLDRRDHNAKWTKCNQGSYYEKVKIQTPNEYDCMLMCEIRCKKGYYPAGVESKAFCTLKLNATRNGAPHLSHQAIQGSRDEDGCTFLSPKKFRSEFEKSVREALEIFHQQKDFIIEFRHHNGRSPAVTIDVHKAEKGKVGKFKFSIDFVPAIRLMEWPKPAENWHLWRLPEEERRLKTLEDPNVSPCVVAKIHPSEYTKSPEESRLWRISFSAVEKFLILHADRALSSTPTCRKDVLRVLKMDLVDLKQQRRRSKSSRTDGGRGGGGKDDDDDLGFSSFYLKTILLLLTNNREWTTNFADLSSDDANWSKDLLRQRYVDALQMVVRSLQMQYIEHYFIKDENILQLQEIPKSEREHIIRHFQRLCEKYS